MLPLHDPRVLLVPPEAFSPGGLRADACEALAAGGRWSPGALGLVDAAFGLYWSRGSDLARRARGWIAPRVRHLVAVAGDPLGVRPYVQLLNTSAWLVWGDDVDPERSHPELLAWLLALGDRMAMSGEVTTAAVHAAAWWLERTDAECAAFAAAAARSGRPDAVALRATAEALPWLRRLHHESLRPPVVIVPERPIPGTGLLVPRPLEVEPPALAAAWTAAARGALAVYRARWRGSDVAAVRALLDWLAAAVPPLLVTSRGRVLWEPAAPAGAGALRAALRDADGVAVRAIHDDLATIARHTERFFAAVVDREALPAPRPGLAQRGYCWLHVERRLLAYDLDEPGMERRHGPPLPWAREMLGARAAHEWAHLADDAGWVPRTVSDARWAELEGVLAAELDAAVGAAPAAVRRATAADLAALGGTHPGAALARLTLARLPDWRANLVVRQLVGDSEAEAYVRHNLRTLRGEYAPGQRWRMLVRYLFEYQYLLPALGLTRMADPRGVLFHSTWFANDFLAPGILDEARFDALAAAVGACCAAHAIDPARLRFG